MFLDTAESPQEALNKAMTMVLNPKPTVLFFPQAQRAVSLVDQSSEK